jgi:nucleoside-diphosphate-sugar epimerase
MKVAVTGATGFVGRHVVAELERLGLSPTLACRSPSKIPPQVASHDVVAFDLNAPPADPFDTMGRPDVLIHLAWGGLPHYESLHHFEDELPSHYRFLKAMVTGGLGNLLVAGTCFEYGLQSGPLAEDLEARPHNPYAYAKNALRIQLQYLQRERAFALTWPRLFYLYGSGQSGTSLFSQLSAAVERGDATFNMSGGEQLRDYLPVAEAARHIVALALNGRNNGIVNVCSAKPVSVRSLVERWIEENGWSIGLNRGYYPYPDHEPMAFWGDRQKMDRCLQPRGEA